MRLLLVEDEAPLRLTLKLQLEKEGYRVDAAADGEEGLFLAREYPFDLAIVDLGLPKLGGLAVIQRLRAEGKVTPILVLTARSRWQDKVEGLEAGADDYLVKPFAMAELEARLLALHRRGVPPAEGQGHVVAEVELEGHRREGAEGGDRGGQRGAPSGATRHPAAGGWRSETCPLVRASPRRRGPGSVQLDADVSGQRAGQVSRAATPKARGPRLRGDARK